MQKSLVQQETRKLETRRLALTSVFGALYAVLVVIFAGNSVLPVQVRFADALLPLAILFGWPAAVGVAIGALVGNFGADMLLGGFSSGQLGVDLVGGSLANLLAGLVAWKIGKQGWQVRGRYIGWMFATIMQTLIVGVIVGSYLSWIFGVQILLQIGLIIAGSIVSINVIGYLLLRALARPRTLDTLQRQGLVDTNSVDSG